jgi:hypothetical protein
MSGFEREMDPWGSNDNAAARHLAYAPSGGRRFGPVYAEAANGGIDAALGMGLDEISARASDAT